MKQSMSWTDAEKRIRTRIVPGGSGIMKCDGVTRRAVISNVGEKISMRTGVGTKNTKAITYSMLRHAFDILESTGRFDSADFRTRFDAEYRAAPCRYSMTGGILVEIGLATIRPGPGTGECCYVASPSAVSIALGHNSG